MWTDENRGRYDRSKLRYPSDLTDEEWALMGPLIPPAKRGGNKRTVNQRHVVDGVMHILSTGCQWAALPKDPPPRSTVNDYLRRRRTFQRNREAGDTRRGQAMRNRRYYSRTPEGPQRIRDGAYGDEMRSSAG